MNQPLVFVSCVSQEFRQTRNRVGAILTRLGYTPLSAVQIPDSIELSAGVKICFLSCGGPFE
jgi:hypothetical protein